MADVKDYSASVALCQRLLTRYGRIVQAQLLSSAPADPDKPWEGPGSPTVAQSKDVHACFVPASGSGLGGIMIPDQLLERVEQIALVEPTDIDMSGFNQLVDDSVVYGAEWVQAFKPGPVIVLYVFGVKR